MDKVVVDSSVVIKWFVAEPHSSEARRLLDEYQQGALDFLAPDLLFAEIGNIVWKKQSCQGLSVVDARQVLDAFRSLTISATPTAILLEEAYRLAVTHQRSVYDCMYLALSVRENCRFITADEKLANAIGTAFPNVVRVADWP